MAENSNHYGATAARPQGKPGREIRPASLTIDIHAHVFVPEAGAYAAPHLNTQAIPLNLFATPATQAINRKQEVDRRIVGTQHGPRLAELDAMGIDLQLCAPAPPQSYYALPLEHAVVANRMVNNGIAAFCAAQPDRFLGMGTVPMQDAAEAVRELERCMGPLGFKGVQILTNILGQEISDPAFEPFWAAAERLGALVMIHPNGFTEGRRLARYYFNNVIGNPLDTTVALHYLIFDGVLERYPNLRILAVHGGGYLPAYSGRIDHAWGARSDSHGKLPQPPSHYLRKIYFDTIVFTPHQLEYLVKVYGVEQIVMGTDFPFDMADSDPIGHICSVESFDAETRAALAGGNAKRLLGL
ncbi:amidohydrolase family protein [Siccirubricoccus phaeus]|uniref:amidohydrolase family protein n=1 Tax=Siccirubricoccus phaeus TaxID=2595053 RepID=UPI0011F2D209|nr:amidohydrolase family protein [Siccirubricoccus phaeus]